MFAGGVLLASILGDWFGAWLVSDASRQDKIRYSGWILDTLGLVAIAVGISSKLDRFKNTNLVQFTFENLIRWLKRFPLLRQDHVVHVGTGHLKLSASNADAYATTKADPNWPTDRKVDWLLERYDGLMENVHAVQRDLKRQEESHSAQLSEIEKGMDEKLKRSQEQSAEVHVGDVGKEFVGLFWIFSGITFATIPEIVETIFAGPIALFRIIGMTIARLL